MSENNNLQKVEENIANTAHAQANDVNTIAQVNNEVVGANEEQAQQNEIEDAQAEIENVDYSTFTLEQLVEVFEKLISQGQIQNIKAAVDPVKNEFNTKFTELLEEKKNEFLSEGGNIIDFQFDSPVKKRFNNVYQSYKKQLTAYRKEVEKNQKDNLQLRLNIIEQIKGFVTTEENINTTYKQFRALQEQWRNIGQIPRDKYNNVWNNYHHHVEVFYDYLHLNRDLRDLDFKHNLEQKLKLVARAEELASQDNVNRTFLELQDLHKIWKEDVGPVDRAHREEIWERFSNASKIIHDKRQLYFEQQEKVYEQNLLVKQDIIAKIEAIANNFTNNHKTLLAQTKEVEVLRQQFFEAGKVPIKVNEETWAKFKAATRVFNKNKNSFYKTLKHEQFENLQKKLELVKIAEANKDNDDFEVTTPLMKKIQNDWKSIGHVPRKDSDKVWKQFKGACNAYFDKIKASKALVSAEENETLAEKEAFLQSVATFELTGTVDESLQQIKGLTEQWKTMGNVPYSKRSINDQFTKAINGLYAKLDMNETEVELLKYSSKIETINGDQRQLDNEHNFIRKKIDEVKGEVNQLENNLQFFSNVDKSNPLVKDVLSKIDQHKSHLNIWKTKLKVLKKAY